MRQSPAPLPLTHTAEPPSDLHIDLTRRQVTCNGVHITMGARAFDMLAALAAKPGRVFTADELFQAVWPGRVVDETNLRAQIRKLRQSIGSHRIVNVSGRGYAYAPSASGQAPWRVASPLPPPATELLGRDDDVAELGALIATQQLVTLLGSGGVGKTQLALSLVRQAQATQPDSVWWVELAALRTAERIAWAVAQAIGLQPGVLDGPEAGSRLGAALAGHEGLLVLDNAEHAAAPLAELLQGLLPQAPGLTVLVTSQQRLRLPGEKVYRLEPLDPQPALQLLVRRAQTVDHRFRLDLLEMESAAYLCQQLDRLPLALEMAGARLPMLGLQVLLQHLGERLRLLSAEHVAVPERQRTLQSALEWSHAMLAPDEQAVLRRLSVFAAPFRLDSAQQVAADATLDAVAVLRAMSALVDKSLLQVQAPGSPTAVRRWRLLETPRLFAARQLDAHHERATTEARHAQVLAALAETALAAYWVSSDRAWMQAWHADHDDFLLAFDRACAAGDAESAAALGEMLADLGEVSGLYGPMLQRVDACLALLPQGGSLARARLWNRTVWPSAHLTREEAARRSVQAWRLAGEPMSLAGALSWCAIEEERTGNGAQADRLLDELRAIEQPQWPPRQRAMGATFAALMVATMRQDQPALRAALQTFEALTLQGGLTRWATQALTLQAFVDVLEGRLLPAAQKFQQAVVEHRAHGGFPEAALMLGHQALVMLMLQDTAAARNLLEQALMTSDDLLAMSRLAETGAMLAAAREQPALAERLLAAADAFRRWQVTPSSIWEQQLLATLRQTLDRQLDATTREQCRAEGGRLAAPEAHRLLLDWLSAAR